MQEGTCHRGRSAACCVQDVLIYRADTDIRSKNTFTVGTGSLRRRSQIKEIYPQAECMELRGNVTTRIQKLRDGLYDAIILAAAGIERLGIEKEPDLVYEYLDVDVMLPAAGQGIIAIEACEGTLPYHMAETISGCGDRRAVCVPSVRLSVRWKRAAMSNWCICDMEK